MRNGAPVPLKSKIRNPKSKIASLCAVALLLLAGCSQVQLYSELPEKEANEMMAVLARSSITCTKQAGEENHWTLMVSPSDFARAVDILKNLGFPRDEFKGIGEQFQKSGLVSSPTEERIRFMHALSQELSNTISNIDGVVTARVHIVIPNNNPYAEEVKPSSASVFIKYRSDAVLDDKVSEIKRFVVNSIEGLKYDNVTTTLFPAEEPPPLDATKPALVETLSIRLAPDSLTRFWTILGSAAGVAIVAVIVAVAALLRPRAKA